MQKVYQNLSLLKTALPPFLGYVAGSLLTLNPASLW